MPPFGDTGQPDDLKQFTLWALSALNLQFERDGERFYTLYPPGGDRTAFNGVSRLQFTFEEHVNHRSVERIAVDSSLFRWILRQLKKLGPAANLTPLAQPVSTYEITSALLPRYTLPGGKVSMASCQIDTRPLLRLTSISQKPDGGKRVAITHHDQNGVVLPAWLVEKLTLNGTSPKVRWNSRFSDSETASWKHQAVTSIGGQDEDVIFAAMIWCNYAFGEIAFTSRGRTAVVPFSNWARLLADPDVAAPAFECIETGRKGYEVAVTSDNRFTVAAAVERCPASGASLLSSALSRCEFTGRRVNRRLLQQCPVTGAMVIATEMKTCRATGLKVNPSGLIRGCSAAAHSPAPVDHSDARLSGLLTRYPELGRYSAWRLCETITRNVFSAGRLKHLLLVVNPETSQIEHAASGNRVLGRWRTVPVDTLLSSAGIEKDTAAT